MTLWQLSNNYIWTLSGLIQCLLILYHTTYSRKLQLQVQFSWVCLTCNYRQVRISMPSMQLQHIWSLLCNISKTKTLVRVSHALWSWGLQKFKKSYCYCCILTIIRMSSQILVNLHDVTLHYNRFDGCWIVICRQMFRQTQ